MQPPPPAPTRLPFCPFPLPLGPQGGLSPSPKEAPSRTRLVCVHVVFVCVVCVCVVRVCMWYLCMCVVCVAVCVCPCMCVCSCSWGQYGFGVSLPWWWAAMSRPHTLFRAAGPQPVEEPSPSCTNMNPGGKPQWERDPGNLSQGLRRERQRVKNRTCLDPMLTSQGGTVPGSYCQQGLCFHFLGLSPESGDGPLPRNSLWHISFLPSPQIRTQE